jgi:hypothetical protein
MQSQLLIVSVNKAPTDKNTKMNLILIQTTLSDHKKYQHARKPSKCDQVRPSKPRFACSVSKIAKKEYKKYVDATGLHSSHLAFR